MSRAGVPGQGGVRLRVSNTVDGSVSDHPVGHGITVLGRDASCDVRLPSRFVSGRALQVDRSERALVVRRIGESIVTLNGAEIAAGRKIPVAAGDTIELTGQFVVLVVDEANPVQEFAQVPWREPARTVKSALHQKFVDQERRDVVGHWDEARSRAEIRRLVDEFIADPSPVAREGLRCLAAEGVYTQVVVRATISESSVPAVPKDLRVAQIDAYVGHEVDRIVGGVAEASKKGASRRFDRRAAARAEGLVESSVARWPSATLRYVAHSHLLEEMEHLILGRGPLERLLGQSTVLEVMVVGSDEIYVETGHGLIRTGLYFPSTERLEHVIGKLLDPLGRRVNASTPLVDGRTGEGFRLNAVVAPVALTGPYLTVRRFPDKALTLKDLIDKGSLTEQAAQILGAFVRSRRNLVISGGTSSGKTTLLNALSAYIGPEERIVTVEDSHELRIQQPHVAGMESVPANIEGNRAIPLRDLVINALRMRPDRIVVGECRGAEALDMIQAMNTGHDGSMTTLHANNSSEAVQRLETMVLMAQPLPLTAVRRQIAAAVHVIVQIRRDPDGRRRVSQITEVLGVDPDTGEVRLSDLFAAQGYGRGVRLAPTGTLPSFMDELVGRGLLDVSHFFAE